MRVRIQINGIVQGIGFRPCVYRLAIKNNVVGFVKNTNLGVVIEAQGSANSISRFIHEIKHNTPPFSQIYSLTVTHIKPKNDEKEFQIKKSEKSAATDTFVSPDIATCRNCIDDIYQEGNRRHLYPFTNCTNCGPRYTIIEKLPYDRPQTSMKEFQMCNNCLNEYNNPADRRFHAQPNACPQCGPTLKLVDSTCREIKTNNIIAQVAKLLSSGKIIAIKGLGGFHLACDATNDNVVSELRKRKRREQKPFAIMVDSISTATALCVLNDTEKELLTSPQAPIVLLTKRKDCAVSNCVSPGNAFLGVMLPYTPLHHLLLSEYARLKHHDMAALVMTSGNISDEPICFTNENALNKLKNVADYFLLHNRNIHIRIDDSITRAIHSKPLMIRRARGYTPQPFILRRGNFTKNVLAVGPQLKNTICLVKNNCAFISQHIGDLDNKEALDAFEMIIKHLSRLFEIEVSVVASDLHPDYQSTKWAHTISRTKGIPHVTIQHHHAHAASCMAENAVDGSVIAIVLDGTGYGSDGAIWGGEILLADYNHFKRLAHFEYFPLPGGDAAIKNPWQTAISLIHHATGTNTPHLIKELAPSLSTIDSTSIQIVLEMLSSSINVWQTSSCGRLFDAVASLTGIRHHSSFEGQAAMELETAALQATENVDQYYPYSLEKSNGIVVLQHRQMLASIIQEIGEGQSRENIALKFHATIARLLADAAALIGTDLHITNVVLSGGCFQNVILTTLLKKYLEEQGMKIYTHSQIPPNDGGISLGQAVVAAHISKES